MDIIKSSLASLRAIISPLTALFLGTAFVCCGYASLSSIFAMKLNQSETPTSIAGIILAMYYLGSVLAAVSASHFINKVGHIRVFSAFASLLSALVLAHAFSPNHLYWALLRFGEGYCIGTITMCLESWINTRANNSNRGLIMAVYMITTYLGASLGQLFLIIPDPSGYMLYIMISILFSIALLPVSMTALRVPKIQNYKSMSYRKAYEASPVGFVCCITSGILIGTFYTLGTIYATDMGLAIQDVSMFMFFGVFGGLVAQYPLGKLSDRMDRRYVLTGICAVLVFLAPLIHFMINGGNASLIISTMLLGSCIFTLYPISVSHVNDLISDDERLHASGMLILAQYLGLIIGPIIVSLAMQYIGVSMFAFSFSIVSIGFVAFTFRHIRKKPDINYISNTPTTPIPVAPTQAFNELSQDDTITDRAKELFLKKIN